MRLITTMLALLLASSGAWAEWVRLGESSEVVFYYEPSTIRKEGEMRKVWEIQDLKERHKSGAISRRSRIEYDCRQERYQTLYLSAHSGPMGTGKTLATELNIHPWRDIPPNTPGEAVLKIVCSS